MTIEIESDVPLAPLQITAFICRRGRKQVVAQTRKFLADCGTKIIVEISEQGKIINMKPEYECDAGLECPRCLDRTSKIRILIESGK